jgi:hypothetical protein
MQIQVFFNFQPPATSKTCLIKKTNKLEFSEKKVLPSLATLVRVTKKKYILLLNVIYRQMTDECKTEKKERMFGKVGSRPNEIITWHMTEVIKEKHEKSVQVTRSPNTHLNPASSECEPEVLTTKPPPSSLYTSNRSTSLTKGHFHCTV